jgi:Na+/phosphate symporter
MRRADFDNERGDIMIITITPLVCALVGLLMYVLSANPKVGEIGRIMLFCGLLVCLLGMGAARGVVRL